MPEPIRFFGTTWLHHDGLYGPRRAAVALGALLAAAAGCLVLRFAYQGIAIADVGSLVTFLIVISFAVCSALAFRRTWGRFQKRPAPAPDTAAERSSQSILMIGFVGILLAYFFRALTEAPGEKLRRTEYELARKRWERRRTSRTGNPAARKTAKKRKHR
ncbi:hypothetical protein QMK28_11130 [Streptomyces sp. H27-D2]|nr:hypothetical protein [Streptomyces sp. H27-D2]MEC4016850.1 hypothetical protein [Streptomyces sp. H27-D2]